MKTDKELLELAAKSAGIDAYWSVDGSMQQHEIFVTVAGGRCGTMPYELEWNPLKNDGDALRLAVKLKLDVTSDREDDCCSVWTYGNPDVNVKYGNDPYAATRRAIVRAAAAIGGKL